MIERPLTVRAGIARAAMAILAIGLLALGPSGVAAAEPGPSAGRNAGAGFLMGTRLSIEPEDAVPEFLLEAVFDEVERLDGVLSNWKTQSEISRLNKAAARDNVRCSPDLFDAVDAALRWAKTTEGAFDPTVEPLVEALRLRTDEGLLPGEDDRGDEETPASPIASAGGTPGTRLSIGWWRVHLDRRSRSVRFDAPGMGIDLGGVGKGVGLDAAARVLRGGGGGGALLDFRGQVLGIGRPGGGGGG